MKTKFLAGTTQELGTRQVRVICSTGDIDRAGEVVVQSGIDVSNYRQNPIVLFAHDPTMPIGTAAVDMSGGNLKATITFAPEGASQKADEICALAKAGILSGVSIGFDPGETEPMNSGVRYGPQKYLTSELLELSMVAIPANAIARVVERSMRRRSGRTLSAQTEECLRQAVAMHTDAVEMHNKAINSVNDLLGLHGVNIDDDDDADEGAKSADFRRRQADLLRLKHSPSPTIGGNEGAKSADFRRRQADLLALVRPGTGAAPRMRSNRLAEARRLASNAVEFSQIRRAEIENDALVRSAARYHA